MRREYTPSSMVKLQEAVQTVSRMNFYLWMYLAQEGCFEEAMDFVHSKLRAPSPFEEVLGDIPWEFAASYAAPVDDF